MGAVVLGPIGFGVLAKLEGRDPRPSLHKGLVPGGVLYGAGWAISGGCPGVILAQLGLGYLPATVTFGGTVAGMLLYRALSGRLFVIDRGSCGL